MKMMVNFGKEACLMSTIKSIFGHPSVSFLVM